MIPATEAEIAAPGIPARMNLRMMKFREIPTIGFQAKD